MCSVDAFCKARELLGDSQTDCQDQLEFCYCVRQHKKLLLSNAKGRTVSEAQSAAE